MKTQIESCCGLKKDECKRLKEGLCVSCKTEDEGTLKACEIEVCVKEKGISFCGECVNFPCDLLNRYAFDETYGDEGKRIEQCKILKSTLVREAREGLNAVSICGHHCDYCFLGQWCGGCRSDYNCCSFAVLHEDKKCPNVVCATDKGLNGCYECDQIEECKKGYYSRDNEYVAKATALFIQRYGEEVYTCSLKKAIEAGEDYPKSFDAAGSVQAAFQLLEKYR